MPLEGFLICHSVLAVHSYLQLPAGQYALATCHLPTAADQFFAAEQCSSSHSQARLAAIHRALTLVASGDSRDLIAAAETLQRQQLLGATDAVLPFHDRYGA